MFAPATMADLTASQRKALNRESAWGEFPVTHLELSVTGHAFAKIGKRGQVCVSKRGKLEWLK